MMLPVFSVVGVICDDHVSLSSSRNKWMDYRGLCFKLRDGFGLGGCFRLSPSPMKSLHTIVIKQTREYRSAKVDSTAGDTFLPLAQKVEEYVGRLGYSNAQTLGVVVQLLTVGKILLDFNDYTERLQPNHQEDLMKRAEALAAVEQHLSQIEPRTDSLSDDPYTQKIIVQSRKH